jgi:hypothetical protein
MSERSDMDDRVRDRLIEEALEFGMSSTEADLYAIIAAESLHGAGIRLSLAVDDLKAALLPYIEALARRVAVALRR